MAIVLNNLYPPLVPDIIPAFLKAQTCKIYFSLTVYNNRSDLKAGNEVQFSLMNQTTNASALKASKYPSGIKITAMKEDPSIENDYKYYIEIPSEDLEEGVFKTNQLYMAQLRFISKDVPTNPPSDSEGKTTGTRLASWLYENKDYFSEWSKICLLRGIEQPHILLKGLSEGETATILDNPLTDLIGKMYYEDEVEEKESLKSYNVKIYYLNAGTKKYILKSDEVYTNAYNPNQINYQIQQNLLRETEYVLEFTYTTVNLFTDTVFYKFKINKENYNGLDGNISIKPENSNGRIKFDIDFEYTYGVRTDKDLVIKRASSKTNFTIWETIKRIPHSLDMLRHVWYDTTIESGVWYKYKIQEDIVNGKVVYSDYPILCSFEDMFLTSEERQLKIQFNPVVSDYKYNTIESQQITLGSKYPHIKRNGNTFYRTFNIGGLISAFMDEDSWYRADYSDNHFHSFVRKEAFTSPLEIYQESKEMYDNYNQENSITLYQDNIYEREFRRKVSEFLYQDNIKLFRSAPEGNILVRLSNISFQPVDTLGRRIYSFTATATEINDFNLVNCIKYNLVNKYYYYYKTSSIMGTFKAEESVTDRILALSAFENYNKQTLKISKIKVQVNNGFANAVFRVKTEGGLDYLRYIVPASRTMQLSFSDNDPIEECHFYGIHLNDGEYFLTNQYFNSTSSVRNPSNNGVYYILDDDKAHKINNYISYNKYGRLITTEEKETSINLVLDYSLYAENAYVKYIYYNGNWYKFSDDGDVLLDIDGAVNFYYGIKEVN